MSEIKLKSCPCCKGISILDEAGAEIRCIECGLTMSIANCFSIGNGWKNAVEEAVTKWNTREPMERIVEKLQESSYYNFNDRTEDYNDYLELGLDEAIEICKEEGGIE